MIVLKIILWSLLGILGLVLIALLLLLFVPVRYRVEGAYKKDAPVIKARFSWLLHIVSARYELEDGQNAMSVRIFGFRLKGSDEDKKDKKGKKRRKKKAAEKKEDKSKEKKKRRFGKKRDPKDLNGLSRAERFFEKLSYVSEDLESLREVIEKDSTKKSFALALTSAKKLIMAIKPRRMSGYLKIGTGDGYSLANVLIGLSFVYGLYGDRVSIEPDWDNEVLEGSGKASGRIFLFTLIRICIKVVLSDDIKKLRSDIDRITYLE